MQSNEAGSETETVEYSATDDETVFVIIEGADALEQLSATLGR